jgi:Zn-finger nucleic acid-binding protein
MSRCRERIDGVAVTTPRSGGIWWKRGESGKIMMSLGLARESDDVVIFPLVYN